MNKKEELGGATVRFLYNKDGTRMTDEEIRNMPVFTPSIKVSKKDVEAQLYSRCCNALLYVAGRTTKFYCCTACGEQSDPK